MLVFTDLDKSDALLFGQNREESRIADSNVIMEMTSKKEYSPIDFYANSVMITNAIYVQTSG